MTSCSHAGTPRTSARGGGGMACKRSRSWETAVGVPSGRLPEPRDFLRCERRALRPGIEPRAFDMLHDEVRRRLDIAIGDERRVVRALRERAEHGAALLEAHDVGAALARAEERDLHDERQ